MIHWRDPIIQLQVAIQGAKQQGKQSIAISDLEAAIKEIESVVRIAQNKECKNPEKIYGENLDKFAAYVKGEYENHQHYTQLVMTTG